MTRDMLRIMAQENLIFPSRPTHTLLLCVLLRVSRVLVQKSGLAS